MRIKLTITLLVLFFTLITISSAFGDVLCLTKTGALLTRKKCKKVETTLNLTNISLLGIKGEKGDQGVTGQPGTNGEKGATGNQGPKGDTGASAFSTMPSGTTVRGVINVPKSSTTAISFPAPIPQEISNNDVMIAVTSAINSNNGCPSTTDCISNSEISKNIGCTGTADLPTAPAGKVCIYPRDFSRFGSGQTATSGAFPTTPSITTSIYGFRASAGDFIWYTGTWAYTAP